jgi:hypothetical protein
MSTLLVLSLAKRASKQDPRSLAQRTRTERATVRLRGFRIEMNAKATATPSWPPCYLQPPERSALAGVAPGPRRWSPGEQSQTSVIAGAGSVRISPTLPTTSVAASTRSRKCASCHEHGYFQPISAAKAYVGRGQRGRLVSCFTPSPTAPKNFPKGRRRDASCTASARNSGGYGGFVRGMRCSFRSPATKALMCSSERVHSTHACGCGQFSPRGIPV